jgi:hypothetical protein
MLQDDVALLILPDKSALKKPLVSSDRYKCLSISSERFIYRTFKKVIPSQTGPNSRGFGHEALPVL